MTTPTDPADQSPHWSPQQQPPEPPVISGGPAGPHPPAGYPQPYSPGPYPAIPQSGPPGSPAPYGYQNMQQQVFVHAVAPPSSGWAIASLIFGTIGMLGGFCAFGIPCIIAVICGHAGLRDTNGGVKGGRGMAIAGLIMGYLFVIPAVIVLVTGGVGSVFDSTTAP